MNHVKSFESFLNESVNENKEPVYKVAGREVTLNKGKKEDGTDWTVTFPNGTEKPLSDVLALINPFPKGIKESTEVNEGAISIDYSPYKRAHGKEPKGHGKWSFEINGETVFSPAMNYGDAVKWAKGVAEKIKATNIKVLG